ncbi:D-alanyl-D-alanine carboxypeptidase family protein [Lichenihabitans psoromatis]|uniref:D-alanyl-D-alanine carboxypeptidase family protein n=1 Tax=Lichenihabitans psoromatis TaxID=2528642 RepID=UPI0010368DDF|nr:D-alanyl-D-alanine carboxypeptidase family protein [Lichenihabitans psoromatis]
MSNLWSRLGRSLAAVVVSLVWTAAADAAPAAESFQTIAPYAILMDADSGAVLFEKSADTLVAPASTAKIMTAEIVFHELTEHRLKLDDLFVVSENAWRNGGAPSGGSAMFAAVNSRIRVEDLLRGLVIDSGNDAAIALAEGIAGSEDAFAARMTARARELGMEKSTFTNPWGRGDPDQKGTPREMARLAIHVITAYPAFYKYFGERDFTWNKVHQLNRNPLLTMNIGADGLKTGDIKESGYGLVGSAVQNGERLVLVVNGLRTARDRANESLKLLSWGFRSFDNKTVFAADDVIGTAQVYGGESHSVDLIADGAVKLLAPRGAAEPLTGKVLYEGPLVAPIAKGAQVAHLALYRGGAQVLDVPLRTAHSVAAGSLPNRALDAGMEVVATFIRTNVFKR